MNRLSDYPQDMFWLRNIKKINQALLADGTVQEVFYVYLNKFEIVVSHLFLIIFGNNKFTLVNLISRNAQQPRNIS